MGSICDLNEEEAASLRSLLAGVVRAGDAIFGRPLPTMTAILQQPWDGSDPDGRWHLRIEMVSPLRKLDTLRFVAAAEVSSGTYQNPVAPEEAAARWREAYGSTAPGAAAPAAVATSSNASAGVRDYGDTDAAGGPMSEPETDTAFRHLVSMVKPTGPKRRFRAPGRVNLMGDHTDYNDGFVLPVAIELETRLVAAAADEVALRSLNAPGVLRCAPDGSAATESDPYPQPSWTPYATGVLEQLARLERPEVGFAGVLASNLPLGGGLSSSASLEVAIGVAACKLADFELDPLELARACRRAEIESVGVECGIMDQAVAVLAPAGSAVFIDCSDLSHRFVPIPHWIAVVVIDSGVSRMLSTSHYNERREECSRALTIIQAQRPETRSLSDIGREDVERVEELLDPVLFRRVRYVVTENQRVLRVAELMEAATKAATLIRQVLEASHASLVQDFEAGHDATDLLVEFARQAEGYLGARQTGAGWGGAVVVLAERRHASSLVEQVCGRYLEATGTRAVAHICRPAQGASEMDLDTLGKLQELEQGRTGRSAHRRYSEGTRGAGRPAGEEPATGAET